MTEQFTLDDDFIIDDTLRTINEILRAAASEMDYDVKYFTIEPNFKSKGTQKEALTGYSLLLDKTLYAKTNLDLSEIIVKNSLLDGGIDGLVSKSDVKSPKDSAKLKFKTPAYGIEYLKYIVRKYAEVYIPTERFGCCDLYVKCSDSSGCIAKDKFHAKACFYNDNLKKGLIFYGKNANQP
ncbi:MAG: hypothetical protein HDS66_08520 [Bacteroidales bacterium]|nr:hypothetical protein [Bacteroidales bacterium]